MTNQQDEGALEAAAKAFQLNKPGVCEVPWDELPERARQSLMGNAYDVVKAYLAAREAEGIILAQRGYEAIHVFNDLCRMMVADVRAGKPTDEDLLTATKVIEDRYEQVRAMLAARPTSDS